MAKRSFKVAQFTTEAKADTVAYAAQKFMGLQGGSSTQINTIFEVYIGGLAGSSAPQFLCFSRDSTVAVTPTALTTGESDAAFDPASAALAAPPVAFTQASTEPQRSASLGLLAPAMNAFGGIVRWVPSTGEEIKMLGNAASFGELSLSGFTGTTPGQVGAHIIYEPS